MNTITTSTTDVLIVGAGPTGLVLASELLRRGISCRVIDQMEAPSTIIRAHGFQPRSMEVLDNMGLIDRIVAHGKAVPDMMIYDGDKVVAHIRLAPLKHVPYPTFWFIQQPVIESILRERVCELGGTVEYPRMMTDLAQDDEGVTVTIAAQGAASAPTEEVHATYVIGCDGSHSRVRQVLGIPFEGESTTQVFLIAEVDLDWDRDRAVASAWFHRDGMLSATYFEEMQTWQVFIEYGSLPDGLALPPLSVDLFQRLFRERTGDTTTVISNPKHLSHFTIRRRLARDYRVGRVFLAGDAAHIHSPAGGLGMNTGVQDAYNLAWKLALVLHGKVPGTLLDTYQEERRPVALDVLKRTTANDHTFFPTGRLARLVRDRVIFAIAGLKVVQRDLTRRDAQLSITYRTSSLSGSHEGRLLERGADGLKGWADLHSAPQAGDRAPDGSCRRAVDGAETSLFREWRGATSSHLLLFEGRHCTPTERSHLVEIADKVKATLGSEVQAFLIVSGGEQPANLTWDGAVLLDERRELHKRYYASAATLYFIRPDGYIGFRSQPIVEEPLWAYLSKLFLQAQKVREGVTQ